MASIYIQDKEPQPTFPWHWEGSDGSECASCERNQESHGKAQIRIKKELMLTT